MRVAVLASGSSGNALLVVSAKTSVLIDAGISGRRLASALDSTGLHRTRIDAVLVTHEHGDHVAGLGPIARRYGLPVFATAGTHAGISGLLRRCEAHEIEAERAFDVGDLSIRPFGVSHDCAEPVGFTLTDGGSTVAVATDLGVVDHAVRRHLAAADCVVLESNHDERMLLDGSYPWHLKRRIMSEIGHLSNVAAARELETIAAGQLSTVVLAHVSRENNLPELAVETAAAALARVGRPDVNVLAAGPAGLRRPLDVRRRRRHDPSGGTHRRVSASCTR